MIINMGCVLIGIIRHGWSRKRGQLGKMKEFLLFNNDASGKKNINRGSISSSRPGAQVLKRKSVDVSECSLAQNPSS